MQCRSCTREAEHGEWCEACRERWDEDIRDCGGQNDEEEAEAE